MLKPSQVASFVMRQDFYPVLLVALVAWLLVMPIMEQTPAGRLLFYLGLTFVLILAAVAIRGHRGAFAASGAVTVIAIPLLWLTMILDSPALYIVSQCVGIALIAMAAAFILDKVVRRHVSGLHAIVGAVCVYLMLGQAWALAYALLEHVQKEPFSFHNRRVAEKDDFGHRGFDDTVDGGTRPEEEDKTSFAQFVYFSFVTMTTLGYGDISPRTAVAETLTWLQAVTGQFYVAILIARLVSALPSDRDRPPPPAAGAT